MSNPSHTLGQVSELTIVTSITSGQVENLCKLLKGLNNPPDKPPDQPDQVFIHVTQIHFARFAIITPPGNDVENSSYLLFSCNYDGDFNALLASLLQHVSLQLDQIWSHTPQWCGTQNLAAFQAWVLKYAVRANMAYTPYASATVIQINKGLKVDAAAQDLFDAIRQDPAAKGLLDALES